MELGQDFIVYLARRVGDAESKREREKRKGKTKRGRERLNSHVGSPGHLKCGGY